MTRICPICGEPYEPLRSNSPTCQRAECKKEHKANYMREYMKQNRGVRRKYNREWMSEYRKGKQGPTEKAAEEVVVIDYAERQKQKTLEMVGKVKI